MFALECIHLDMELTRENAWQLLNEYTKSESLIKHALAVEAAVRGYARIAGADETGWGIVALLHDFDYERWPSLEDHPFKGSEILREKGYQMGYPRDPLARGLQRHATRHAARKRSSRATK